MVTFLFWTKTIGLESELVLMEHYHAQNKELSVEIEQMENELKEMESELESIYQKIHHLDNWLNQLEGLHEEVDTLYGVLPPILKEDLSLGKSEKKEMNTVRIASLKWNETEESSLTLSDLHDSIARLYERADQQKLEYNQLKMELESRIMEARMIPSIRPAEGRITSTFGMRQDPFTKRPSQHLGIDIANQYLSPIYATANGTVLTAERQRGYGLSVYLDHGNGYQTLYAHLAKIVVHSGEKVEQGDIIGYMGSSGRSTGVHLHYEIHKDGQPIDPFPYLN